jgi:RNA polymerase sigma-70 factor (ECF subfamily)
MIDHVRRVDDALVQRLYTRAAAERWQLPTDAFASFLLTSAQRAFGDELPDAPKLERYFESLHLQDLALACACAVGDERAWDVFVVEYRPVLYRAADALDPWGGAREVADSLYGELFGLKSKDGQRQSHLRYFHGRSSLATWLRAVLSQRFIDRRRAEARIEPLPEEEDADELPAPRAAAAPAPALQRFIAVLRRVMTAVIAALAARDRLRLRLYYAQDMTLKQIGKVLGESEATASRQLMKTRRLIREEVQRRLRDEERMSEAQMAEGFAAIVEDAGTLDLAELLDTPGTLGNPGSARKPLPIVQSKESGGKAGSQLSGD